MFKKSNILVYMFLHILFISVSYAQDTNLESVISAIFQNSNYPLHIQKILNVPPNSINFDFIMQDLAELIGTVGLRQVVNNYKFVSSTNDDLRIFNENFAKAQADDWKELLAAGRKNVCNTYKGLTDTQQVATGYSGAIQAECDANAANLTYAAELLKVLSSTRLGGVVLAPDANFNAYKDFIDNRWQQFWGNCQALINDRIEKALPIQSKTFQAILNDEAIDLKVAAKVLYQAAEDISLNYKKSFNSIASAFNTASTTVLDSLALFYVFRSSSLDLVRLLANVESQFKDIRELIEKNISINGLGDRLVVEIYKVDLAMKKIEDAGTVVYNTLKQEALTLVGKLKAGYGDAVNFFEDALSRTIRAFKLAKEKIETLDDIIIAAAKDFARKMTSFGYQLEGVFRELGEEIKDIWVDPGKRKNFLIGASAVGGGLALAGVAGVVAYGVTTYQNNRDTEAVERGAAQETMKLLGASATALDHFFARKGLNPATRLDQQTLNEHGLVKLNKRLDGKDDQTAYRAAFQDLLNQAKNSNSPQGVRAREQLQALTNALRVNIGDFGAADLVVVAAVLHHLGANSYPLDMSKLTGDNLEEISKILKARLESGFTADQQTRLKAIADSSVGTLSSIWGWIKGDTTTIDAFSK